MARFDWDRVRRQRGLQRHEPSAYSVGGFRDEKQRKRDAQRKADIKRRSIEKQRAKRAKLRRESKELRRRYGEEQRRLDATGQRWLRRWRAAQQLDGTEEASE